MAANFDIGPYDPCPCGSGEKYKFCCAAKAKDARRGRFPIGTVAHYGPDDKITTKIAAGVIRNEKDEDPIIERWSGDNVASDPKVAAEIKQFFAKHGVKSVTVSDGVIGCPHEEGTDFPQGVDCPYCPFWIGKQGTAQTENDPLDLSLKDPTLRNNDDDSPLGF
jgi:hypothetical protein